MNLKGTVEPQGSGVVKPQPRDELRLAAAGLRKGEVADEARFAGPHDQANERGSLRQSRPAAEQQNDAGVGHGLGQSQEIISIAGDEHEPCTRSMDQNVGIGGVAWQHLPQAHDRVPQGFKGKAEFVRDVVVEEEFHRP